MPVRKKRTPARRTAVRRKATTSRPVRRRTRRTMGSAFSKASMKAGLKTITQGAVGGAAAKVLADNVASNVASVLPASVAMYSRPITAALGAYLTKTMLKNNDLALGMAGVAGAEIAAALITGTTAGVNDAFDPYGMDLVPGLSGYEVPLSEDAEYEILPDSGVYASSYSNMY